MGDDDIGRMLIGYGALMGGRLQFNISVSPIWFKKVQWFLSLVHNYIGYDLCQHKALIAYHSRISCSARRTV